MLILHVEVGGSYGGSLRALENYLAYSRDTQIEHDFMVYYPTPGAERLRPLVKSFRVRFPDASSSRTATSSQGAQVPWKAWLKKTRAMPLISQISDWTRTVRDYPRARNLAREFRKGGYDLVHVNNTFTYNVEALVAGKCAGVPVVAHARNPIETSLFNKWALGMTCGVATVNQCLRRQLVAWAPTLPIETCYDGIELTPVNLAAIKELRNYLLKSSSILIGSAGRLDQQKGYAHFIGAARRVLDVRPDVMFAVAGDGPLRPQLEQLIVELRMTDHFHLLGFRQDIQNVIGALDLFVSSSLWEGLPIAVVEAILLAKPIVVTNVGGSPEVVLQGENGYVVPAADQNALAKGILNALENMQSLSIGAREAQGKLTGPMEVHASARVLDEFFRKF
jgi:glycosyltransferase involved in cell wall biosynthesis